MNRFYKIIVLFCLTATSVSANHLLGGEIRASHISGQTYKVSVHLYFDTAHGAPATEAQTAVTVCFGDGVTADLPRISITNQEEKKFAVGIYEKNYTFSAAGSFQIAASIANRGSYLNLPNANNTTLFLWTVVNTQISNSTPALSYPPLTAGIRQNFSIDLKSAVPDNDSVSVSLQRASRSSPGTCGVRMEDPNYFYPNDLTKNGTFKVNNTNKTLVWSAPERAGNYLYGFVVREWRDGIVISESYHEGTITVTDRPGETVQVPEYEPAGTLVTSVIPGETVSPEITMRVDAYPIPTEGALTFKVYTKKRSLVNVQLINLQGKIVRETTASDPSVLYQDEFDLSRLSKGVYVLRASTGNQTVTQKIIR
jgi:hypothetical protein